MPYLLHDVISCYSELPPLMPWSPLSVKRQDVLALSLITQHAPILLLNPL